MKARVPVVWMCLVGLLLSPVLPEAVPASAALFGEFGLKDEMEMGRKFEVLVKSRLPLVEDPEVRSYVQSVVDRIVATLPPQPYSFQTSVLLNNQVNAFATPGGFVFVHTGLIQHLDHESELAGVLSHEVAHVTQRHIARRVERGQVVSVASLLGAVLGALAGGGGQGSGAAVAAASAAGQAAMLNYSRADESDADQFGLQYLVAAGYNPAGLSGAFRTIQEQSFGRGAHFPTYLSTHPDLTTRLAALASRIRTLPGDVQARPEDDSRFRRVQTLIWARYGDPQHAAQVFSRRDVADPMTHLGLGILHSRQNRVREAEKEFGEALRLAPEDPLILRESGIFHYDKGDLRTARQQLERGLELAPDDYMGQFYYARLLDDAGDSRGAQELYRRVLRHVPEDAEVHTYYGRSLGRSNQVFEGYLHLAYAAVYSNDERRARSWEEKARASAETSRDKAELERFSEISEERRKIWSQAS